MSVIRTSVHLPHRSLGHLRSINNGQISKTVQEAVGAYAVYMSYSILKPGRMFWEDRTDGSRTDYLVNHRVSTLFSVGNPIRIELEKDVANSLIRASGLRLNQAVTMIILSYLQGKQLSKTHNLKFQKKKLVRGRFVVAEEGEIDYPALLPKPIQPKPRVENEIWDSH